MEKAKLGWHKILFLQDSDDSNSSDILEKSF